MKFFYSICHYFDFYLYFYLWITFLHCNLKNIRYNYRQEKKF